MFKTLFAIIFMCLSLIAYTQEQISIGDFGLNPNDGTNAVIAVQKALKLCAKKDSCVLYFTKGRYDFWPDFTTEDPTIGMDMKNLKNLTVDGNGSEFVFHGKMQIAKLQNCTNVKLQNFSVDWEKPFITQAIYVQVTDEFVDLEIDHDAFVIENGQFYLIGEGWKSTPTGYFTLYDKDKQEILYKTHDWINQSLFHAKAEEIESGIVRFFGKPEFKPELGTYQVIYAGRYITTGIEISECKDSYLKDLTIYHALSNGVYGFRSENITMESVNMTVNESKGRVYSIVADASHFTNCKGLIKIINCKHTGQGDDFINVHGRNTPITTVNDKYSLTTGKWARSVRAGDEIWFINDATMQRTKPYTVESSEQLFDEKNNTQINKITFSEPIPKEVTSGDFIENKTWNPSVEIRNCEILKKHRARGILVTTPEKVIIENNYFRTAGTAILIEGDINYWFESGANTNVSIRNNIFEDCLTSGCATGKRGEWGEAIITITPSHFPDNENSIPFHRNIKIEHNTFKTFDVPLVHARSVGNLIFNNNEIIKTYTYKPYAWQKSSFLLDGCRDVSISGNKFDKNYSSRIIEMDHMKRSDIEVDQSSNFKIRKIEQGKKLKYIDDFLD